MPPEQSLTPQYETLGDAKVALYQALEGFAAAAAAAAAICPLGGSELTLISFCTVLKKVSTEEYLA